MKTYILTLVATLFSVGVIAQKSTVKSEKTGFYVHETETEYMVKASFNETRSDALVSVLKETLGNPNQPSGNVPQWVGAHYAVSSTKRSLKIFVDKENATAKQLAKFKKLADDLQAALGQPKPPTPPATN